MMEALSWHTLPLPNLTRIYLFLQYIRIPSRLFLVNFACQLCLIVLIFLVSPSSLGFTELKLKFSQLRVHDNTLFGKHKMDPRHWVQTWVDENHPYSAEYYFRM